MLEAPKSTDPVSGDRHATHMCIVICLVIVAAIVLVGGLIFAVLGPAVQHLIHISSPDDFKNYIKQAGIYGAVYGFGIGTPPALAGVFNFISRHLKT